MYPKLIKPLIDFFAAFIILALLSPVLVVFIVLLFVVNGGAPFFRQPRAGKNGIIFTVLKLKTMNDARDKTGQLLPDAQRITGIGKLARNTSIDELPQLINVLKGEMSLVGPRPLLVEYLPLYNEVQKRRHLVRPGITGWAQVNGRNTISWEEKFKHDVWYVDNLSFLLDVKILFLTALKLFRTREVNSSVNNTMSKFTGSN
jgi:undecaprenyl phosphate N,N'-diacetylbacillosamine 1-phosphate transferase